MNNLPTLPLIDGCLFIDNSSWIEGFSTCYRFLQYKSLNLRVPYADKPSLNFGSAIHLALEHRYRKYKNGYVDDQYYSEVGELLTKFFDEHPPAAGEWRTLNWAMSVIKRYNERYDMESFSLLVDDKKEPMVELSFALPLYTHTTGVWGFATDQPPKIPIIYSGRIDLPVSVGGQTFVVDHKTTSILGPSFFERMKMSAQQKGYCWAFEQLTDVSVSGYIINAIRTKEPPAYVMYNTKQGKYTPESWWQESLQRERFLLKPGELDEWKRNTIALVEEFFHHYQSGYMPMKTTWCTQFGRCPYFDVCSMAEEDRGVMLASGMFTDNVWSPLKEPSQAKQ